LLTPCAILLTGGFLAAQKPQSGPLPAANPSFRVSVNLVQVDAVVTDSKGHHVTDLRAEDFEVIEDGRPQKITNFSYIALDPPRSSGAAPGQPPQGLRKEDVRRSIVLMIDDLGFEAEADIVLPAMAAARKFVAEQMAPGDLVSVTTSRGGMGFYQQFTSDRRQLLAAIDHIAQRPDFGRWTVETPRNVHLVRDEPRYDVRPSEPPNPIGYLSWAIRGLRNVPGRKAVVLFSHSFTAPPALIDLANRSGVVIYVIDPHGADLRIESRPVADRPDELVIRGQTVPLNAPYRLLAKQTGGLFMISAPGASLSADLAGVLEDMSGYYLLGYQAERSEGELKGRAIAHQIQVSVRRGGLTVRARNGNMGVPDEAGAGSAPRTTHEFLQQALFSPFAAGSIRLRLDPTYAASAPNPSNKRRRPWLRALLEASGDDLRFAAAEGGATKLTYSALVAVFKQDGTPAAADERTFTLNLTPEQAAQVRAAGIHAMMELPLDGAGPYLIRAAVRDENSGNMGSAYSFLAVPDFNKAEIALSSIKLAGSDSGWHGYSAGASVGFECEVFGIKKAPQPPQEPRVEMEIRLFHSTGGAPVVDSERIPVPPATLAAGFLAGRLQIGRDFEPGDYAMQLVAYDRLASPKKQIATQWTNLTVVKPAAQ
jgi:VWFA-related protein